MPVIGSDGSKGDECLLSLTEADGIGSNSIVQRDVAANKGHHIHGSVQALLRDGLRRLCSGKPKCLSNKAQAHLSHTCRFSSKTNPHLQLTGGFGRYVK